MLHDHRTMNHLPHFGISPALRWLARMSIVGASLTTVAGCSERGKDQAPARSQNVVSDGAHNNGNANFFFLPPIVAAPSYSGTFDASQSPVVTICQLSGSGCAPTIAQFSMTSGTGSEVVRLDATSQLYIVNWHTDQCIAGPCTLPDFSTYRVRVTVGLALLGYADVQVVPSQAKGKNVNTNDVFAIVDGRTVPLKFRIENGAVAVLPAGGGSTIIPTSGGTIATSDGKLALVVPPGTLAQPTTITVQPSTTFPPTAGLAAPVYTMGPSGASFNPPLQLTLAYDPARVSPSVRLTMLTSSGSGGRWQEIAGSVVDSINHTVTAPAAHFSLMTAGASAASVTATAVNAFNGASSATVGQTIQAVATVYASDGTVLTNYLVGWQSSNPAVASVDPSAGVVTALAPGAATITATSGTASGSAVSLTISPRPTASAGGPYSALVGTTQVFQANATGDTLTYAWNFGDSASIVATGPNPPHLYATVGTYVVTLTVTDVNGVTATSTTSSTVYPPPAIVSFSASPGLVTAGSVATLTAVFSGGQGAIDQGVGAVVSGTPVTTTALGCGQSFTLTVTSVLGPSVSSTITVPVRQLRIGNAPIALASGESRPVGVAVGPTYAYWSNVPVGGGGDLRRIPLFGGPIDVLLTTPANTGIGAFAIDARQFYLPQAFSASTIYTLPLSGGTPSILVNGQASPTGVAVNASSIFWTDTPGGPGTIWSAPISGSPAVQLADGQSQPGGIAVNSTSLFWTNSNSGQVMTMPLAGGTPTAIASGQAIPFGIAVDACSVYWGNQGDGTVMRMPLLGGTPEQIASGQSRVADVAVDSTSVYWVNNGFGGNGQVMRLYELPTSCAAVAAAGATNDGEYLVDPDGAGPIAPFKVYCAGLSGTTPLEYLTLAHSIATNEPNSNFSRYAGGGACPCPDLIRYFTKVRLDLPTMSIRTDDQKFTQLSRSTSCDASSGNCHGPEDGFATAGSCIGADTSGTANADLRGTPFAIAAGALFASGGYLGSGTATISSAHRTVTLTGGGYCGTEQPCATVNTAGQCTSTGAQNVIPLVPPYVAPVDGLIAHLPFASASDLSGSGNGGGISGTAQTSDRFGNPAEALAFSNAGDVVTISSLQGLTSQYTVTIWANFTGVPPATNPSPHLISNENGSVFNGILGVEQVGNGIEVNTWDAVTHHEAIAAGPFSLGWHLVAVVVSQSQVHVFVDAVDVATSPLSNYTGSGNRPWYIGAAYSGQTFQGALDDFRVYNRALSGPELVELFHENGFSTR